MPAQILIVEVDPEQAALFSHVLRLAGHSVETVATAEEAMPRLADSSCGLLLADWDLPGAMQGDTLISRAKAAFPDLKTILFSNHMNVDEAAVDCGADASYRKYEGIVPLRKLVSSILAPASA